MSDETKPCACNAPTYRWDANLCSACDGAIPDDCIADAYARGLRDGRDWARMSPREQWEHAKAMPKIAGPWEADDDGDVARRDACGEDVAREEDAWGPWKILAYGCWASSYPTRSAADAALRAAGWILVDEDETKETKP